ncbi:hypothetical protein ACHAXT_010450 [Thalassiosira profunda]
MLASLSMFASIVLCFCVADATIAVPYTTISHRPVAFFVPRGGDATNNEGRKSSPDMQQLLGVIDLRPEPEPDIIHHYDHRAVFPTPPQEEDENNIEEVMDQAAASSHTIGQLCSTVYLMIAYDFDNGKTVLHRTLGGAKLMAFVDGARSRRHEMGSTPAAKATKLVLVLVPSASSSAPEMDGTLSGLDPTKDEEWNPSGANFLVARLSEAFGLVGEEYETIEPFDVEMILAEGDAETMNDIVSRHFARSRDESIDEMATGSQELIKQAYKSAGGVGQLSFY